MPIYEYECDNCEHSFEITQSFEHKEKKKCPECGKLKLYKVISEPMIIIKNNNTIGSAAERNTKMMGRTKVQELDGKRKESQAKEDKPWYADSGGASKKELKKMTKSEKAKYILTGKKQ
tara:strand:+ start:1174 stop:1530 length:357 start_codon:yes stop_codon:yes gene_type:complete